MVYLPADSHPSTNQPGPTLINFFDATNNVGDVT